MTLQNFSHKTLSCPYLIMINLTDNLHLIFITFIILQIVFIYHYRNHKSIENFTSQTSYFENFNDRLHKLLGSEIDYLLTTPIKITDFGDKSNLLLTLTKNGTGEITTENNDWIKLEKPVILERDLGKQRQIEIIYLHKIDELIKQTENSIKYTGNARIKINLDTDFIDKVRFKINGLVQFHPNLNLNLPPFEFNGNLDVPTKYIKNKNIEKPKTVTTDYQVSQRVHQSVPKEMQNQIHQIMRQFDQKYNREHEHQKITNGRCKPSTDRIVHEVSNIVQNHLQENLDTNKIAEIVYDKLRHRCTCV